MFCDDRLDRAWANEASLALSMACAGPMSLKHYCFTPGQLLVAKAWDGECCFGQQIQFSARVGRQLAAVQDPVAEL